MVQHTVLLAVGVAALLLVISGASYYTKRWVGGSDEYMLAGREISTPLLIFGVLAFGFAADISVLFAIFGIVFGYFPALSMGIVYIAWMLYGLLLGKFVRNVGTYTITEWYEIRFNYPTRAAISLSQVLGMAFIVAAGSLGGASILNGYAGWPINQTIVVLLGVIGFIVLSGGMWGVTISDAIQSVFGIIIFPLILLYLVVNVGGIGWLVNAMPTDAVGFSFPGGWNFTSLGAVSYWTWTAMWLVALVYGATIYWIRAGTARTARVARAGYVGAGLIGLGLMVFVMPLLAMYGFAIAPGAYTPFGGEVPPAGAWGVLAANLPLWLGVLIPIGFIAAAISTHTTDVIGGSAMVLQDFYHRFVEPEASSEDLLLPSRIISILVILAAFVLALTLDVEGLVVMFLVMLGISSVVILVDLYWKVFTPNSAFAGVTAAIVLTLFWALTGMTEQTGLHHIWVALGTPIVIGVLGSFVTEGKYYDDSDWTIVPSTAEQTDGGSADLMDGELQILESIETGGTRFADFIDTLQTESHTVNEHVENLDRGRFIVRKGWKAADFYEFEITDKGEQALESSEYALKSDLHQEHAVNEESLGILSVIAGSDGVVREVVADTLGMEDSDVTPYIQRLLNLGYIEGYGYYRQKLRATEAGEAVLGAFDIDPSEQPELELREEVAEPGR